MTRLIAFFAAAVLMQTPGASPEPLDVSKLGPPGKDSITLTGTLEYQACDDTICYNPASIPLSWTLSLRPLVVERAAPRE